MVKRPVDILPLIRHVKKKKAQLQEKSGFRMSVASLLNQPSLLSLRCVTLHFWTRTRRSLRSCVSGYGRSADDEAMEMLGGHGHCDAVTLELPSAEKVSC